MKMKHNKDGTWTLKLTEDEAACCLQEIVDLVDECGEDCEADD